MVNYFYSIYSIYSTLFIFCIVRRAGGVPAEGPLAGRPQASRRPAAESPKGMGRESNREREGEIKHRETKRGRGGRA